MNKIDLNREWVRLILNHPPEIPKMAKTVKHFDRIREPDFFRKMAFWVFPSIDTSAFALQILQVIREDLKDDRLGVNLVDAFDVDSEALRNFVLRRRHSRSGGFFQTRHNQFPTLHATHCSIALAKAFDIKSDWGGINYDGQIGSRAFNNFYRLKEESAKPLSSEIFEFIAKCYDQESGGFVETPIEILEKENIRRRPSIIATSSAIWICFQLEQDIEEFLATACNSNTERIISFVNNLKTIKDGCVAFKNTSKSEQPWICSSYYAERLLRNLGVELSGDDLQGMIAFILGTKNDDSAFCAGDRLDANLIHTKNALSLISRYYDKFVNIKTLNDKTFDPKLFIEDTFRDVSRFLKETYVLGGFSPAESFRYLPNIYSTRMACDILRYFKQLSRMENITAPQFDFMKHAEILKFLNTCYSREEGAYRGYSYSAEYIPEGYIKEHFLRAA